MIKLIYDLSYLFLYYYDIIRVNPKKMETDFMVIHNIDSPEDQHKYAHEMYTSACSLSDESVINQYAEELKKAERNLKDHLFREYFKATF